MGNQRLTDCQPDAQVGDVDKAGAGPGGRLAACIIQPLNGEPPATGDRHPQPPLLGVNEGYTLQAVMLFTHVVRWIRFLLIQPAHAAKELYGLAADVTAGAAPGTKQESV